MPGRAEDLSRLFEAHYADMVRLAFYLTGSWAVAEELAQEAFLRLWRRWGGLRDNRAALGYLRATVVNLSHCSLRRRLVELRHQRSIGEEAREPDPTARVDIARALAKLPARKRACAATGTRRWGARSPRMPGRGCSGGCAASHGAALAWLPPRCRSWSPWRP